MEWETNGLGADQVWTGCGPGTNFVKGRDMGLKSYGEHGVKALLRNKIPSAFRRFDSLACARDAVMPSLFAKMEDGTERGEENTENVEDAQSYRDATAVFLDGNVILQAVPETVSTLAAYTEVVYRYVKEAMVAGALVIVVFDEPHVLTSAKKEEQCRRDQQRRQRAIVTSDDLDAIQLPEDFSAKDIEILADVHILKNDRRYRIRLFDEVIKRVFDRTTAEIEQAASTGNVTGVADGIDGIGGCLILDGVDLRGADRPHGVSREPAMHSTNPDIGAHFVRSVPIGEGDVKLMWIDNRLRELKLTNTQFANYHLALTSTIDTDSIAIMLLDIAKRRVNPYHTTLSSLLCMREPPNKRDREWDPSARASFNCFDPQKCEALIQQHLWSMGPGDVPPEEATPVACLNAMLAFTSAAALCGCDFTLDGLKGVSGRFDHFWNSLPKFVTDEPEALACFGNTLAGESVVALNATRGLRRVCYHASEYMTTLARYKKQAANVQEAPRELLKRSVWAAAYWAQVEYPATVEFGFHPTF